MNKLNSVKKIAISSTLAAVLAAQTIGMTASATTYYYVYNSVYYPNYSDAVSAAGSTSNITTKTSLPSYYYYNSTVKGYVYSSPSSSYKTSTTADASLVYTNSLVSGTYYPNKDLAQKANTSGTVTSTSTGQTPDAWFCSNTSTYYSTYDAAYLASGKVTSNIYKITNYGTQTTTTTSSGNVTYWYSSTSGKYYLSYYDAVSASTSSADVYAKSVYKPSLYFSMVTGVFYSTQAAALAASGNDSSYVKYYNWEYSSTYYDPYYGYYYNGTYYNPYYYGDYSSYYYYGNYSDPSWQYWYNKQQNSTTVATGDADKGDAYITGSKSKAGWDYIENYIENSSNSATIKINLNEQQYLPEGVLDALDGTKKTLVAYGSGIKFTIKGANVTKAKTVNLALKTTNTNISSTLISKATKNAISYSKLTIGSEGSLGFKATATVKFPDKRIGNKVTFYRYDSSARKLISVGTTTINEDGYASFTISYGGSYLAVVK